MFLENYSLWLSIAAHLASTWSTQQPAGVWDRVRAAVSEAYDGDIVMINSSCVRVHQHGAVVKREAPRPVMVAWDAPGAG